MGLQVQDHKLPKVPLQLLFDRNSEGICLALIVLTAVCIDISQAVSCVQRAQVVLRE